MSGRLLVATRKGLFTLEPNGSSWKIVGDAFIGDPVTMVLRDQRDGTLYAALRLGHFGCKLHRSDDAGTSWEEVAVPSYARGNPDGEAEKKGESLEQIWCLEIDPSQDGALWAGTIPGGLFHSSDRGASWTLNDALWERPERSNWFGGGYDHPGIHSVCVDPTDAGTVAVGVSCGGVWVSRDSGQSWDCRSQGMFASYMPPDQRDDPTIQDPHRMVQCLSAPSVFWSQHHNGIFRSVDSCASWQQVDNVRPSDFGFGVAVHPHDPDTAWFAPAVKDECRVPVDGRFVITRTRDGGRSFETLARGLPEAPCYDLIFRHALDVDSTGEVLAAGSTTGSLWTSEDGGDGWQAVSRHLPPIYCLRFHS